MNTEVIPAALSLLVLCSIQFVESLPINKRMSGSITPSDIVNMSRSIWDILIDINQTSEGLNPLFRNASYLAHSEIFKPETQCLERKVCMGRIFTSNHVSCDDESNSLTYAQLTDYYNELVLQLKLAEHNLKVAVNVEIKEVDRNKSLKTEGNIIRLLNKSILPALEYTLNISEMKTNCSATRVIADRMISLYSNCVAVQSSNEFLRQTTMNLLDILDYDDKKTENPPIRLIDDGQATLSPVDEHKEWCIVQ